MEAGEQRGRDGSPGPGGPCDSACIRVLYCTEKKELSLGRQLSRSMFPTHGQVHKSEHVELCHDGEAQEHTIQKKAPTSELLVQLPLVQMNAKHLQYTGRSEGSSQRVKQGADSLWAHKVHLSHCRT